MTLKIIGVCSRIFRSREVTTANFAVSERDQCVTVADSYEIQLEMVKRKLTKEEKLLAKRLV